MLICHLRTTWFNTSTILQFQQQKYQVSTFMLVFFKQENGSADLEQNYSYIHVYICIYMLLCLV